MAQVAHGCTASRSCTPLDCTTVGLRTSSMADDDDVEPVDEAPAQVRRKTSVDLIHGGSPMCVQLRHIGSANKAQFCLLPREYSLQSNKLLDLVKKTWGLTLPNLIIACDAGSAHPMSSMQSKDASNPPADTVWYLCKKHIQCQ